MVRIEKLGHIVLGVSDLDASCDFYQKVLGLEVVAKAETPKAAFLSLGAEHHDLALVERPKKERPDPDGPGLVHMAWRLADFPALQAAYAELTEAGIEAEPIQHQVTKSLYVRDPDGHLVEIYCDRWETGEGKKVMQEGGPERRTLDMVTGEPVGPKQELLKAKVN